MQGFVFTLKLVGHLTSPASYQEIWILAEAHRVLSNNGWETACYQHLRSYLPHDSVLKSLFQTRRSLNIYQQIVKALLRHY